MSGHLRGSQCDNCGAETTNGVALCQACRTWFLDNVELVPVYFRNLARWRPSSAASDRRSAKAESLVVTMARILESGQTRGVRGPSGLDATAGSDRIGHLLGEVHADLTGWLRALADDRPQLAPVVARILTFSEERTVRLGCALMAKRVDTLTTLPWVRDLVRDVAAVERRLLTVSGKVVPGWYAGACRRCGTPTYVMPGLTWTTCGGCGTASHAADHLEVILTEARGWVARPMRIAEALVALVDTEQSPVGLCKRISKWQERGRIVAVRRIDADGDETGPRRYALGDVLDLVYLEGATRTETPSAPAAPCAC